MWKNIVESGLATDANMAFAHYMLDTQGYKHTLRISNSYNFFNTAVIAPTRLSGTLYVYCVYCLIILSAAVYSRCADVHQI
jgi:hypothetical protein